MAIHQFLSVHNEPTTIEAFVAGAAGRAIEHLPDEVVKDDVLMALRSVMRDHVIEEPTFFHRTDWCSNEWTLGSYSSYVLPYSSRLTRSQIFSPLANSNGRTVLRWAGEANHDSRYGTVDGALMSGYEQARQALQDLKTSAT